VLIALDLEGLRIEIKLDLRVLLQTLNEIPLRTAVDRSSTEQHSERSLRLHRTFCACMIARCDCILEPSVCVSSEIEGLRRIFVPPQITIRTSDALTLKRSSTS
jgi:hypothetical protein